MLFADFLSADRRADVSHSRQRVDLSASAEHPWFFTLPIRDLSPLRAQTCYMLHNCGAVVGLLLGATTAASNQSKEMELDSIASATRPITLRLVWGESNCIGQLAAL